MQDYPALPQMNGGFETEVTVRHPGNAHPRKIRNLPELPADLPAGDPTPTLLVCNPSGGSDAKFSVGASMGCFNAGCAH